MKDFDDLYRIGQSGESIDSKALVELAKDRQVELYINPRSISEAMIEAWPDYLSKKHYKGAKDLPKSFMEVVEFINKFLKSATKLA